MHPELDKLELPQLVEQLEDLEGRRTPVGWRPEDAVLRSALERRIMELIQTDAPGDERREHLRLPCSMDVKVRSKKRSVRAQARDIGVGGVFVETQPDDFAVGTVVEIEVRGNASDEHGLRVRGTVSWVTEKTDEPPGVGVSFAHDESERHERRLRRFVVELLRHRMDHH
jgi:Tfp pilus assembly protein PilZ